MRSSGPLLAVMLLAMAETSAFAQGAVDLDNILAKADADHDGRISRDEFQVARAARFDKFDRNHDGFLDNSDMPRRMRSSDRMQKFQAMLNMADTDHDGRVSREEYESAGTRMFGLVDVNHDGYLDQDEREQAVQRMRGLMDR